MRSEMDSLDQQVARVESQLLKLRQWDGQIWLIPDKSATTKEPIVVFVDGMGATIQRVDHPEQRKQLDKDVADSAFSSYLDTAKSLDQYVVFEVKPSGIGLFQDLVKSARDKGFDVGYDALEEDKNPHLSPLPSVDESTPPTDTSATTSAQQPSASNDNSGTQASATPAATSPKPKAQGLFNGRQQRNHFSQQPLQRAGRMQILRRRYTSRALVYHAASRRLLRLPDRCGSKQIDHGRCPHTPFSGCDLGTKCV